MTQIYKTTITELGPSVEAFLEEKILILFKGNAPAELAEYCVLHEENRLDSEIEAKDTLKIKETSYQITAVGSAVNKNLDELGHITLKFDGKDEPELPGTMSLEKKELPSVRPGDTIEIIR
ncbi:PTS glucitol/sorbitol transporter subunit IIA [Halobacillus seohaensis]|uniref:PTS glucitol/sorbitol transporter subunit IIA n=1 Tax=Halobacillus seohaensis TaxID=447421 RepID=A0ABW2EI43_9BACI